MDNVIAILDILVWPLILLVIVLVVRKALTSLILSIQKIKYRDWVVDFSKALKQTEHEFSKDADVRIKEDPSDNRLSDALKLSPDRTVVAAWNALELCARQKVMDLAPKNESFQNPLERPLDYLEFKGTLTPATARAIRDLRTLRNQVVHFGVGLVAKEDGIRYVSVAEGILKAIDAVTELPKVKLTAMTLMVMELNSLIDSRQFDDLTIDEVSEWIRNENIVQSLAERAEGYVDLSHYTVDGPYPSFVEFYHEHMKQIYCAYGGGSRWGVEKRGLCLLLAWTNELIQQGSGWYPDEI